MQSEKRSAQRRRRAAGLYAAVVIFSVALQCGCTDGLPDVIPVSGTVTWQGAPLAGGTVTFHSDGVPQRPATGQLDGQGRFQLTSFRPGDGVAPGMYRVTVHSYRNDANEVDDAQLYEPQWRIPKRYGNPATSGLTVEITGDDDNVVQLKLAP